VCTEQKKKETYWEKHLARAQARIRAAGDHLVEITSASGAPWRRALEREGRASKCCATHQTLDVENGHRWLPWRTREATRCAYMALEASGFSGLGRWLLRCNSGQDGRTGTFLGCIWLATAAKVHSLQECSAAPSGCPCAKQNVLSIGTFHLVLLSHQLDGIPHQI